MQLGGTAYHIHVPCRPGISVRLPAPTTGARRAHARAPHTTITRSTMQQRGLQTNRIDAALLFEDGGIYSCISAKPGSNGWWMLGEIGQFTTKAPTTRGSQPRPQLIRPSGSCKNAKHGLPPPGVPQGPNAFALRILVPQCIFSVEKNRACQRIRGAAPRGVLNLRMSVSKVKWSIYNAVLEVFVVLRICGRSYPHKIPWTVRDWKGCGLY
eukprot:gene172-biopygen163